MADTVDIIDDVNGNKEKPQKIYLRNAKISF